MPQAIQEPRKKSFLVEFFDHSQIQDKEYLKEYLNIVILGLILCFSLAIISYNPKDPTTFQLASQNLSMATETSNIFGPLGASIADWSYQLFGIGCLLFSFVFFLQIIASFRLLNPQSRFYLRAFGYPQLMVCLLGLFNAINETMTLRGLKIYTGGWLGHSIFSFTSKILGHSGATIILALGSLASLTLALGIRPMSSVFWLLSLFPGKKTSSLLESLKDASLPEKDADSPNGQLKKATISKQPHNVSHFSSAKETKPTDESILNAHSYADTAQPFFKLQAATSQNIKNVASADFQELVTLLEHHKGNTPRNPEGELIKLKQEALLIEEKLKTYGVLGTVQNSQVGPVISVHEFEPASGIKVNKVIGLQDDLALALKAQSLLINMQPGKSTLAIEVPSSFREVVSLKDIMQSEAFARHHYPLPMVLGKNIDGTPLITDLSSMPHILVAGSTGSGKSVCINVMLLSLMMSKTPSQLRLILIDPKMLELSNYNGIGHLLMPVVTEPTQAAGALKWVIQEMERRYHAMKEYQVRNILAYNDKVNEESAKETPEGEKKEKLPYIVVVVDELCDLMMTAPKDVEDSIQRLAQKARAAGIHLILATQRPSVDVLTGVIKANLPCRLSFQVASRHDSRTIIETIGAERLLGKGDMLFLPPSLNKLTRAQCAFVNDTEINSVSDKLRQLYPTTYENAIIEDIHKASQDIKQKVEKSDEGYPRNSIHEMESFEDRLLFDKTLEFAASVGHVSTSSIQREFRIGYNKAARIMDKLIKEGHVGQADAAGKPRPVLKR